MKNRFPEADEELGPCPFCGSEVQWATPTAIMCMGSNYQESQSWCGALFSFPHCSVSSHARRLFNRREVVTDDQGGNEVCQESSRSAKA